MVYQSILFKIIFLSWRQPEFHLNTRASEFDHALLHFITDHWSERFSNMFGRFLVKPIGFQHCQYKFLYALEKSVIKSLLNFELSKRAVEARAFLTYFHQYSGSPPGVLESNLESSACDPLVSILVKKYSVITLISVNYKDFSPWKKKIKWLAMKSAFTETTGLGYLIKQPKNHR